MSLATRLSGLSPFGPIFGKELRTTARRRRNHALRVGYLSILFLLLLFAYMIYSYEYSRNMSVAQRVNAQNELGTTFFAVFSIFCVICMGLIAPVLTSTAVGAEKLAKTLPVLLMTPITAWQIVSGKLFSRLLIVMMLIGLSLPVLAVVRLLGGVELWQMFAVICICTAFAVGSAAIGLFYSTLINRAYAVILLAYATMILLYLIVPMLITIIWSNTTRGPPMLFWQLFAASNPVMNVALVALPDSPLATTGWYSLWLPGIVAQLVLALLLLTCSALLIRRQTRREGETHRPESQVLPLVLDPLPLPIPVEVDMAERAASALQAPSIESSQPDSDRRPVGDNPVLWREIRRPLMSTKMTVLAIVGVIFLLLLSYACFETVGALDDEELQIGYAWMFGGMWWLVVAVISATAIAQEKESDTWTVLLVAPLSGRQIVLGKLLGLLRRLNWSIILITLHFALFALTGVIPWISAALVVWVIVTFNAPWVATGLYLSLRMRNVTSAVVFNLLIPVLVYGIAALLLGIVGAMVSKLEYWVEVVGTYLPYLYMAISVAEVREGYRWEREMLWFPVLGYDSLSVRQFAQLTLLVGLAHVVVAATIVGHTIMRFNRLVGRAGRQTSPASSA